jgi:hypothetical protein
VNEQERQFDELPREIVARLRAADRAQPIVDPRTDRAVLDAARSFFSGRPEARAAQRARRLLPAAVAAAAAVVLAVLVVQPLDRLAPHPDDVDGSGQVDILDAFALARAPGGEERSRALAARVVTLSPRSAR